MRKPQFDITPVSKPVCSDYLELHDLEERISRRTSLRQIQSVLLAGFVLQSDNSHAEDHPINHSIEFDGKSTHLSLATLRYPGKNPITIDVIVTPSSLAGEQTIIGNQHSAGLCLQLRGDYYEFAVHNGRKYLRARSDEKAKKDESVHLTGVFDGQMVRLYVDQKPQKAFSYFTGKHKASNTPLMIGADPDSEGKPQHFFDGSMSHIRISAAARDKFALWKKKPFGPVDRFDAAYLDFSLVENNTIYDKSRWKHHAKLQTK